MIRFSLREGLAFGPLRVPAWKVLLAVLVSATLLVALMFLSLALLLLLVPLALVGLLARRLRRGRVQPRPVSPGVIEADYVVIVERRLWRDEG